MKLYFFAEASERKPSSAVYTSEDVITSETIIETLIQEGYTMGDIRCVGEDSVRSVAFVMKGQPNEK